MTDATYMPVGKEFLRIIVEDCFQDDDDNIVIQSIQFLPLKPFRVYGREIVKTISKCIQLGNRDKEAEIPYREVVMERYVNQQISLLEEKGLAYSSPLKYIIPAERVSSLYDDYPYVHTIDGWYVFNITLLPGETEGTFIN